jgi:hypothetical protein
VYKLILPCEPRVRTEVIFSLVIYESATHPQVERLTCVGWATIWGGSWNLALYYTKMCDASKQSFSDVRVRGLLLSPSSKISDFENPSDSDSVCLLVYAFIL